MFWRLDLSVTCMQLSKWTGLFYSNGGFSNITYPSLCLLLRRWILERKLADAEVSEEEQYNLLKYLEKKETEYMRLQRHKMGVEDFDLLTIIGRGAFGEVFSFFHFIHSKGYNSKRHNLGEDGFITKQRWVMMCANTMLKPQNNSFFMNIKGCNHLKT